MLNQPLEYLFEECVMVDIGCLLGKNDRQNPWISHGERSFEKGLYGDAIRNFTRAIEHEPQNSFLWYRLGVSQNRSDQREPAVHPLRKATELDPQNRDAWITLLTLLADTHLFDEAIAAIDHVVLGDSEPYLQELKCEWLERIGRYADAAPQFAAIWQRSALTTNICGYV